jgi:uncharacterized protein (TIGR02302 family)
LSEKRPQDSRIKDRSDSALKRLDRLVAFASVTLLWERIWRALLVPGLVVGTFLCLSFAGLWLEVGQTWRVAGVVLLGLAFLVSLFPLLRLGLPSRKDALARIDRESGLTHRPASGLDDSLANAGDDAATNALWMLHRRRIEQNIAALRSGTPSPRMVEVDRYALRAAVFIALIACGFLAGPEKYARVAAAFDWRGGSAESGGFRMDAWIDPPAYTGRAPVLLNVASAEAKNSKSPLKIEAPINSTVIARAAGGPLRVETEGALEVLKDDKPAPPAEPAATAPGAQTRGAGGSEQRLGLRGDARLSLWHGNSLIGTFELSAIPDKPPQIQLTDAPRANVRGSLTLSYKINDDYGVTGAEAGFANPVVEGESHRLRSLVEPPRLTLNLAPGARGLGEAETTGDLSDHPWAGTRVTMVLSARDEGGNEGKSDPIEIALPQKAFAKPIARALAEQRRNLILFPDERGHVQTALESLMLAPELFGTTASVYLGLSVAVDMLRNAETDAQILAVADYMWGMALEIENGNLTEAERDLRAAEQKLRDALQNNAPDDEIAKLTQDLRAAMDKFLKEMAEKQMREQGRDMAEDRADPRRSITRKDLQSMLDRMQDMARAGDRANAQKMLEQLQNLMENLQTSRRRESDPARREMNHALSELDKMAREQQDLRDETHQQNQGEADEGDPRPGSRRVPQNQPRQGHNENGQAQPNSRGQMSDQALRERQQALRNRLEELQKRMQKGGQAKPGLDEAGKAMEDAEAALGRGMQGRNDAVDAQGRAIEALRREAQNLAQQMQGQGEPGTEVGDEEGESGSSFRAQGNEDADPLGRPLANDPLNPRARFDPMGVPAAQRAQRVLEELRKRLADPFRPREEMDYLERLLKRY